MVLIRLLAHLLAITPLCILIYAALNQSLGADPQETLLHDLGIWSLRFLLLSLAIRPLSQVLIVPRLVQYRRMVGLYFAFYLCLHAVAYCWFFLGWDWQMIGAELIKRPYLTVGIAAFVLTLPLVATSTRWAQRRLKRRWKQLHKSVYVVAILGLIHFYWQVKADIVEPLIYGAIFVFLMIPRLFPQTIAKMRLQRTN